MRQSSSRSHRSRCCAGINVGRFVALTALSTLIVLGGLPVSSIARATRSTEAARDIHEWTSGIAGWFGQDTGDDDEPAPVDENPNDRVASWDICQREVEMYVGETYTLVPTPKDVRGETVHGVVPVWSTAHPDIVGVTADGELGAYAPGRTTASIRAGFSELTLNVVVLEGRRPDLTGDEWDAQHGLDCREPDVPPDTEKVLSPGGYVDGNSEDYGTGGAYPPISADVRKYFNSVANPRFDPVESVVDGGATKARKNLGSDNYSFAVPVLSLPGRTIGAGFALSYNSRPWTKDTTVTPNTIKWNYNKGWPAVGWTIGYGRIVENYNGSNDRLLIQGDGTRIILKRVSAPPNERFESQDGTFIEMKPDDTLPNTHRLRYPDGTLVTYEKNNGTNNKMLPVSIRTTNGASIVISYKAHVTGSQPLAFPFKWAINTVTDTCGRVIKFHYDDNTTDVLTRITAPNQTTGADHTLIEIGYDDVQMVTNFSSSIDVQGRPAQVGGVRWFSVVKAIRYPDTGQGWVFEFPALGATNYGMAKAISVRRSMTGVGAGQYGTEIARTDFAFNDSGTLSDSPTYSSRTETWTTSDQTGAVTNQSGAYSYSSTPGNGVSPRVDTITNPDGSKVVTTTSDDSALPAYGKPTKIEWQTAGGATLRRMTFMYGDIHEGIGGLQPELVESLEKTWNESGSTLQMSARVTYDYYSAFGRLKTVTEFDADETTARRITSYEYKDGAGYTVDPSSAHILDRVTKVEIKTGGGTVKARTEYLYDDFALGGGMEGYGIPEPLSAGHADFPPNQGTNFDSTKLNRGNVTRVREWHDPATAGAYYDRILKYDIFGNVVSADVSCCRKKVYNFLKVSQADDTRYSQPESVTDGSGTVTLKTTWLYDFHTGLVKSMTNPAGDQTTFIYDAALRLDKVTYPALSGQTSEVDITIDDANRTYAETVKYTTISPSTNQITTKSWLDGAGRVVRSGTGSGAAPSAFDAVATKYDNMGRTLQTTNPYAGSSTATTVGTVYWTVNTFDALSRVDVVTLPDGMTVGYDFDGAKAVTVTDPAGRKRRMEYDPLGRMTKVIEHNTSGTFSSTDANWTTTYGYDTLDNLTSVTQSTSTGSQSRSFSFDGLSRLLTAMTPEGGSETYTYFDHAGVKKMTHSGLGVETHNVYDELNRPKTIWYTGLGGDDDPAPPGNPALPLTVADTARVDLTYFTSGDGKGQISTITNGGGLEAFQYDPIGRVSQRTWTVTGGTARTTTYSYNAADQITAMNYPAPSSKQLAYSYDSRGRVSGVDKTNATTLQYLSAVMYSPASQVTSLKIGPSANNLAETFAYSADRLQLTSQTVTKGSTLMSLTYDYTSAAGELGATLPANRNNGQLLGISGTLNGASAAQTFTYDTLGRLVTATGQGSAGNDTVGAYAPATAIWNLRNSNSGGAADIGPFGYGAGGSGFLPISGDWDGDGDDTVGLYDPVTGTFYLRNSNSAGPADVPPFTFGAGGGIPVAGDWNGDGIDTIGFYTSSNQTFYLRNSNSAGPADVTPFSFGAFPTWIPIVGDWDGDGDDTIGSFDPSNNGYYLRNTNSPGGADISFTFGTGGGTPLAGDWNGDGVDTIGYRTSGSGIFNLRNSNTPGGADVTPFTFSSSSDIPIMGDWDGLGASGTSWQRRYGYDRWTNRTSVHDATTGGTQIQSVGIVGGTSTPTNRITTVTEGLQNFGYDYDAAGNVTGDGVHTYKYDAANRLAEVDGGTTATYSYDAANRRVKTVALGVTSYTVWEGMHPIMEIDSTGALVEDYVYSGARLLATERGGVAYFHHQDRLSTRLLTNSAGAVVGTSSHLPYGEDGLQTGVESRHKFTTYDRDGETDNDYAVNRHSSPSTGRFLQPDPVSGST